MIRGERIERVGTIVSLPVPNGHEAVSTEGLTVLPGLWDLHVHLMYAGHPDPRHWFDTYTTQFERVIMPASAEQMLMAGVTTVRDLAAPLQPILAVKERIASGEIPGPTLYIAGPALTKGANPNAVQMWNVSGAAAAKAKTSQLIDAGVDWIKVINAESLAPDEMKAIVVEAHRRGRKVASHAFSEGEIRQGLIAGIDDFQHVRTQTPDPPDIVALIRDRVRNGPPLYWTVTAGGNGQLNAAYLATNPEFLDGPANFIGLPQPIIDDVRKALAARTQAATRRGGASQSQEEINAIVKRKIAQIATWGCRSCSGRTLGAGVRSRGRRRGWKRISGSASSAWTR